MMGRLFKEMVIIFLGLASFVYLIYPSLGIFELLPDALPLVGSVDEGTATLILISVFRYYGLDLSRLFGKRFSKQHPLIPGDKQAGAETYIPRTAAPTDTQKRQRSRR